MDMNVENDPGYRDAVFTTTADTIRPLLDRLDPVDLDPLVFVPAFVNCQESRLGAWGPDILMSRGRLMTSVEYDAVDDINLLPKTGEGAIMIAGLPSRAAIARFIRRVRHNNDPQVRINMTIHHN
jgi:hypothetical protein